MSLACLIALARLFIIIDRAILTRLLLEEFSIFQPLLLAFHYKQRNNKLVKLLQLSGIITEKVRGTSSTGKKLKHTGKFQKYFLIKNY
ncbi:MAG: hypothetical protein CL402_00415 [Acidiferrobacteraceae bacterium]|nr:hypothetical protein [Acidiferrobacteraceae bacterium]